MRSTCFALLAILLVTACEPRVVDMPMSSLSLLASGTGQGTITSTPRGIDCGATCSADFEVGTLVTLHAVPDADSSFLGWSGGACDGTGDCAITVSEATGVTAMFALSNSIIVTLAGTGTGTVTSSPGGISCPEVCSAQFTPGDTVVLTATPSATSSFAGWSGGGCSGLGTCSVSADDARAVTATFALHTHALTVTRAGTGDGTVTSSPAGISCGTTCSTIVDHGTGVTLTAVASTKSERLATLQGLLDAQARAFNEACVGRTLPVLFERDGRHPGQLVGRTPYLQGVHVSAPSLRIGDLAEVAITECFPHSLAGTLAAAAPQHEGTRA